MKTLQKKTATKSTRSVGWSSWRGGGRLVSKEVTWESFPWTETKILRDEFGRFEQVVKRLHQICVEAPGAVCFLIAPHDAMPKLKPASADDGAFYRHLLEKCPDLQDEQSNEKRLPSVFHEDFAKEVWSFCAHTGTDRWEKSASPELQGKPKDGCFIVSPTGQVGKAAALIQKMDAMLNQFSTTGSRHRAATNAAYKIPRGIVLIRSDSDCKVKMLTNVGIRQQVCYLISDRDRCESLPSRHDLPGYCHVSSLPDAETVDYSATADEANETNENSELLQMLQGIVAWHIEERPHDQKANEWLEAFELKVANVFNSGPQRRLALLSLVSSITQSHRGFSWKEDDMADLAACASSLVHDLLKEISETDNEHICQLCCKVVIAALDEVVDRERRPALMRLFAWRPADIGVACKRFGQASPAVQDLLDLVAKIEHLDIARAVGECGISTSENQRAFAQSWRSRLEKCWGGMSGSDDVDRHIQMTMAFITSDDAVTTEHGLASMGHLLREAPDISSFLKITLPHEDAADLFVIMRERAYEAVKSSDMGLAALKKCLLWYLRRLQVLGHCKEEGRPRSFDADELQWIKEVAFSGEVDEDSVRIVTRVFAVLDVLALFEKSGHLEQNFFNAVLTEASNGLWDAMTCLQTNSHPETNSFYKQLLRSVATNRAAHAGRLSDATKSWMRQWLFMHEEQTREQPRQKKYDGRFLFSALLFGLEAGVLAFCNTSDEFVLTAALHAVVSSSLLSPLTPEERRAAFKVEEDLNDTNVTDDDFMAAYAAFLGTLVQGSEPDKNEEVQIARAIKHVMDVSNYYLNGRKQQRGEVIYQCMKALDRSFQNFSCAIDGPCSKCIKNVSAAIDKVLKNSYGDFLDDALKVAEALREKLDTHNLVFYNV